MTNTDMSPRAELPELTRKIHTKGRHITIETAGISYIPNLCCDLMSISPKLSNSTPTEKKAAKLHNEKRLDVAVSGKLIDEYEYQLKFVIDCEDDMQEVLDTIEKIGNVDSKKVLLMPQAVTKRQFLKKAPLVAQLCKENGFAFGQRLHILLWDGRRGT